jgi:hypothetical protein
VEDAPLQPLFRPTDHYWQTPRQKRFGLGTQLAKTKSIAGRLTPEGAQPWS